MICIKAQRKKYVRNMKSHSLTGMYVWGKGNSKGKEKIDLFKNKKEVKTLKYLIKEIKRKFVTRVVV